MRISDWSSDVCSSDLRRERVDDPGDDGPATVQMELRHVLAGKAVRPRKPEQQRVVELPAVTVPQGAEGRGALFGKNFGAAQPPQRRRRRRPGNAHDRDPGASGRRRECEEGRSAERRVGTECVRTFRCRSTTYY